MIEKSDSLPLASSSSSTTTSAATSLAASSPSPAALRSSDTLYIPLTQLQGATAESTHARVSNASFSLVTTSEPTSFAIRPFLSDPFKDDTILLGLSPPLKLLILLLLLNSYTVMFGHVLLCKDGSLGPEFEQAEISGFVAVLARRVGGEGISV